MVRCQGCGSGYLDPRPTTESIGLAYRMYYTHSDAARANKGFLAFMRALAEGYLDTQYGLHFRRTSRLGNRITRMLPPLRRKADYLVRHLKPEKRGERLLDVGCGNGSFLRMAQSVGWNPIGLDPDPAGIQVAGSEGFRVIKGTLPGFPVSTDPFDSITMSHSIEHVHRPLEALGEAYRLLRPGGRLWVATPNLASLGHRYFGRNWVALDPPRHLLLFTENSLKFALEYSGFNKIQIQKSAPGATKIFAASRAISRGEKPFSEKKSVLRTLSVHALLADFRSFFDPAFSEEIVFLAYK
jgi:SAM-dependent methyltransferase